MKTIIKKQKKNEFLKLKKLNKKAILKKMNFK